MAKLKILLLATAVSLALVPAADARKYNVRVGIGDQTTGMFTHPDFKRLKIKRVRYFIPWHAVTQPHEMQRADEFVTAAKAARASVFMHISSDNLTRKKAKLPSTSRYKRDVTRLVKEFRKRGVKEWGARNEANHDSQATWRSPSRAAFEFKTVRRACKGCTVVALDVLDQRGVERYMQRFYKALGSDRRYAKIVGIHNYSDTNRKRSSGTRDIIREVKRRDATRTQFWLTETGGVVEFGKSFPCSERRAASRVTYMFSLARKFRSDIKRLYAYNWQGTDCQSRFDTGLVRLDGSTRPAYDTFARGLRNFAR
jgi:hypothetical protein